MSVSPPTPPAGLVQFDYAAWIAQYPEFLTFAPPVAPPQATHYFNRACLYCDNSPTSPWATDTWKLLLLLNMMTAHVAFLFGVKSGNVPTELVGRVSNATTGSVTVATVYAEPRGDISAWLGQTIYGAAFLAATKSKRTGFYVRGPGSRRPLGGFFNRFGGVR